MFVLTKTGNYINFNPKTDSLINNVTATADKKPYGYRSYEYGNLYDEYLKNDHIDCKSFVEILRQNGDKIKIFIISDKFNDGYIGKKIVKEFSDNFIKKLLQVSFTNPEDNFIWDVTKEYPSDQFDLFRKNMLDKLNSDNEKEA